MNAVEFTADLRGEATLVIPAEVANQLPKTGRARVILMPLADTNDTEWHRAAYEHFLRDDAPEDAIYDQLR